MANPLDIKGMIVSAMQRMAKKYEVTPDQIAVKIFLHPVRQALAFRLFVKGQSVFIPDRDFDTEGNPLPEEEGEGLLSFNKDILNKNGSDLMNTEIILNHLVLPTEENSGNAAMQKFAVEVQAESLFDIHLMAYYDAERNEAYFYLYKGEEAIRQVYIEKDF